jgi:hypothetical protein
MKETNLYLLLAAGIAVAYYATKPKAASGATGGAIEYGTPNGWQYFDNGTAISPDGTYYYQGKMVWNPMM